MDGDDTPAYPAGAILTAAPALPAKTVIYKVGVVTRQFNPPEPYEWRDAKTHALVTDIWYPADPAAVEQMQWIGSPDAPFAKGAKAARDAALIPGSDKFPLILLSHGIGGSSAMMAWFGAALASHGYIAAAVNHPGNNALEDYTLPGAVFWGQRAHDLSALLDVLLADSTFGSRIDPKRVGAAGFSLGLTVLELAGGIAEFTRYQDFCKSPKADGMCTDTIEYPGLLAKVTALVKTDSAMQAAFVENSKSHRDPRIRAIFAMAPALGPAFDPASLAKISVPTQIVAGAVDTTVPPDSSAKFFAARIPGAQLTILTEAVGHYTFLATCAELGDRTQPRLCIDQAGILRDEIHAQTVTMAWKFFDTNLK